jgi:hypothetical protein
MSEVERNIFKYEETRLGPNTNNTPLPPVKKNFHLNLKNKWLPIASENNFKFE